MLRSVYHRNTREACGLKNEIDRLMTSRVLDRHSVGRSVVAFSTTPFALNRIYPSTSSAVTSPFRMIPHVRTT